MNLKKIKLLYAIILFISFPNVYANVTADNFGIKNFNLNVEYENPKNCKNDFYFSELENREMIHRECKEETTIFEELFGVEYLLLDGKIYDVTFDLKVVSTYYNEFIRVVTNKPAVQEFIRTGNWPNDSYIPKFKTDYSKLSNLLIERINEDLGKFTSSRKAKDKTYFAKGLLNEKSAKEIYDNLGSSNYRRDLVSTVSKQPNSEVMGSILVIHSLSMMKKCNADCNVDKYSFEWKRRGLNVLTEIFQPEKKPDLAINYHIRINYHNPFVKNKVVQLRLDAEKKLLTEQQNQKKVLEKMEKDRLEWESKLKQEELNLRKKDF